MRTCFSIILNEVSEFEVHGDLVTLFMENKIKLIFNINPMCQ